VWENALIGALRRVKLKGEKNGTEYKELFSLVRLYPAGRSPRIHRGRE